MDAPPPPAQAEGPPPFRPRTIPRSAPVAVPTDKEKEAPRWSHHGFEDDEPYVHHNSPVPLVLAPRRLGSNGQQFVEGLAMIGGLQDRATVETRLKQQPDDQVDSLLLCSDDDLFVGNDAWREEQDRRYMAASQEAWKAMPPHEIAREGYMAREAKARGTPTKKERAAQRKARLEQKKKREGLYPQPNADDLRAMRNK